MQDNYSLLRGQWVYYLCRMRKKEKVNIRTLTLGEIESYFEELGEPKFRAKQVYEWLWQKPVQTFEGMTNISKELRKKLSDEFSLPGLTVDTVQQSEDGTIKTRFKTHDGHFIEGVLIPTASRFTACLSSQIGCSLSCKFCATGYMDRKRNLEFDEIYDQVAIINKQCEKANGKKLSNIVFMGMGEPLLNLPAVLESARLLLHTIRREILDSICLNRTLSDVTLVATKREPFDVLAEGLETNFSRGERI